MEHVRATNSQEVRNGNQGLFCAAGDIAQSSDDQIHSDEEQFEIQQLATSAGARSLALSGSPSLVHPDCINHGTGIAHRARSDCRSYSPGDQADGAVAVEQASSCQANSDEGHVTDMFLSENHTITEPQNYLEQVTSQNENETENNLERYRWKSRPQCRKVPLNVDFTFCTDRVVKCQNCEHWSDNLSTDMHVRLLAAINHNDVNSVQDMLQTKGINPNYDIQMKSPICRATAMGNIQILNLLLDAGADPNTPNFADLLWERRPVHIAASKGHLSALQLLVRRGADINQLDSDSRTPLHWVSMYGQAHMIPWMVRAGAAINVTQTDGFTPLHTASCLGHREACKLLIEGGADMSRRDRDGWTPLHTAVCYGYADIVELLLDKGADPLVTTTSNNDSALHIACSKGVVEMIKLLLKRGVPIEGRNSYGSTPLYTAVYYNRLYATYFLIKAGANVDAKNYTESSPVYLAAIRCEMKTLQLLLDAGCKIRKGISLSVAQQSNSVADTMEDLASKPQTLTQFCLSKIRQTLAPNLQENAGQLPLPKTLRQALVMRDLTFVVMDGTGGQMMAVFDPEEGHEENVFPHNGLQFKLLDVEETDFS